MRLCWRNPPRRRAGPKGSSRLPSSRSVRKNGSKAPPAICLARPAWRSWPWGVVLGGSALFLGIAAGVALAAVAAYLFASGRPFAGTDMEYGRLSRALEDARQLARQRESRVEKCKKAVEEAERSVGAVRREWRQWLSDRNLRETFLPETVGELRGKVELGRSQLLSLRSHRERIDAIQNDIDGYIEVAAPLASGFGVPFDRNESSTVAAAAGTPDRDCTKSVDAEESKTGRTASDDLGEGQAPVGGERIGRSSQGGGRRSRGCSNPEVPMTPRTFASGQRSCGRERAWKSSERGALGRLQRLSGPGEPLEALKKQLGDTDFQTIRHEKRLLEEKIEHADAEIRERSTKRGSIQTELRTLTGEEESSSLRAERHRLLEEIRVAMRGSGSVRVMAEKLLKEAQAKFEKESASRESSAMPNRSSRASPPGVTSRYSLPLGSSEIQVTDSSRCFQATRSNSAVAPGEQLFLSLRFGLIQELGQRSERLPVIVDEALVNFDPERGLRVASRVYGVVQDQPGAGFHLPPDDRRAFPKRSRRAGRARTRGSPDGVRRPKNTDLRQGGRERSCGNRFAG